MFDFHRVLSNLKSFISFMGWVQKKVTVCDSKWKRCWAEFSWPGSAIQEQNIDDQLLWRAALPFKICPPSQLDSCACFECVSMCLPKRTWAFQGWIDYSPSWQCVHTARAALALTTQLTGWLRSPSHEGRPCCITALQYLGRHWKEEKRVPYAFLWTGWLS